VIFSTIGDSVLQALFLPLRVTEKTSVLGGGGFAGYLRWLLHSPAETETPVSSVVREQKGGGIVASYR